MARKNQPPKRPKPPGQAKREKAGHLPSWIERVGTPQEIDVSEPWTTDDMIDLRKLCDDRLKPDATESRYTGRFTHQDPHRFEVEKFWLRLSPYDRYVRLLAKVEHEAPGFSYAKDFSENEGEISMGRTSFNALKAFIETKSQELAATPRAKGQ